MAGNGQPLMRGWLVGLAGGRWWGRLRYVLHYEADSLCMAARNIRARRNRRERSHIHVQYAKKLRAWTQFFVAAAVSGATGRVFR